MVGRPLVIAVLVIVLAGCGRFYYGKPGTFPAIPMDFRADSDACIREVGIPSGNGQYALVTREAFQRCMEGRGWVREKKVEPGYGWYRGIEGDDVVNLADGVKQPDPDYGGATSAVFCQQRAANAGRAQDWATASQRCMAGY